jgi:hypothetical protein
MKKYFSLLLIVFLFGCKTTTKLMPEVNPGRIFNATVSSIGTLALPYYICDEFIGKVYNKFTVEEIENRYSNLLKKNMNPYQNIHDPGITDTIISFSSNGNSIRFYRAMHADFVFHIELTNPRIFLFENIRPGMSKTEFQNKFSLRNEIPNAIRVGDLEVTSFFTFHFRREKLVKIDSDLYLD